MLARNPECVVCTTFTQCTSAHVVSLSLTCLFNAIVAQMVVMIVGLIRLDNSNHLSGLGCSCRLTNKQRVVENGNESQE